MSQSWGKFSHVTGSREADCCGKRRASTWFCGKCGKTSCGACVVIGQLKVPLGCVHCKDKPRAKA